MQPQDCNVHDLLASPTEDPFPTLFPSNFSNPEGYIIGTLKGINPIKFRVRKL